MLKSADVESTDFRQRHPRCSERGSALLERCRDIAPDAGDRLRAPEGARAAGSFLPEFHHADIPFGEVVGEGNAGSQASQHRIAVCFQAFVQVGGLGLLAPGLFSRTFFGAGQAPCFPRVKISSYVRSNQSASSGEIGVASRAAVVLDIIPKRTDSSRAQPCPSFSHTPSSSRRRCAPQRVRAAVSEIRPPSNRGRERL